MKSILENRPALAAEVDKVAEVAGYLWQKGWAERNGGNITVNITEHVDDAIRAMEPVSGRFPIGTTLPRLKGCYFFCKGTNKRMRDLARRPMENGSVIRILDDCASYEIIADKAVKPTSELASHLAMHNQMIASGNGYKAALHTHPIDLIAMTHNPAFLEKDVLTNLLWSMIPETRAFCPKGLGIVPYKMPSSVELAEATIAQLREYDVVMWEKHGVCAVGPDIFEAFDQVDVLSKSAQIYLTARSMGFEPAGTTQEQMDDMKRACYLLTQRPAGGDRQSDGAVAFRRIVLKPSPVEGLDFVDASYRSVRGVIGSSWAKTADAFTWKVVIPANASAVVYVPTCDPSSVREGDRPARSAEGVKFLRSEPGYAVFEVGSGAYCFNAARGQ